MNRVIILAVTFACFFDATACAQTRQVSLEVSLTNAAGEPVASLPIVLRASSGVLAGAVTDQEGHATINADVPQSDSVVGVRLGVGADNGPNGKPIFISPDSQTIRFGAIEFWKAHCARWDRTVVLEPGTTNYSVTGVIGDCVQVFGTVTPSDELGDPPVVFSRAFTARALEEEGNGFRGFVQKASDDIAFIIRKNQVLLRPIAASQTGADIDLGVVDFGSAMVDSTVHATVTNLVTYHHLIGFPDLGGVTLVQVQGGSVWTQCGKLTFVNGNLNSILQPIAIPAGTYYIAPGWCTGTELQKALIDAVRRGDDLTNSGVPQVTAIAGQTANIEVDLAAAYAACHNLRRP